jgi:hypothetical protein
MKTIDGSCRAKRSGANGRASERATKLSTGVDSEVYLTRDQVDTILARLLRFKLYKWSIGKL